MNPVKDRVVCVTGASSGIGLACARAFAAEGARLLLIARRLERLETLQPELAALGAAATQAIQLDVRDADAVFRCFESLPDDWRSIEILVNNAAISPDRFLHKMTPEAWHSTIQTNLDACFNLCHILTPFQDDGPETLRRKIIHRNRSEPIRALQLNPRCEIHSGEIGMADTIDRPSHA